MQAATYLNKRGPILRNHYQYLTDNTINGRQLSSNETNQINQLLNLGSNDPIELIYSNNGNYSVGKNVLAGLTRTMLFKIEGDAVSKILRANLVSVNHLQSDVYSCDKLQCDLITGESATLAIFHSKACQYFCDYLQKSINTSTFETVIESDSVNSQSSSISISISAPQSPISPATTYFPQGYQLPIETTSSAISIPIQIPILKRQTNASQSSSVISESSMIHGSPIILRSVDKEQTQPRQYSPPLSPQLTTSTCPPNSPSSLVGSPFIQFRIPGNCFAKNLSPPTFFVQDYHQHAYPSHQNLEQITEKRQMGFNL